MPTPTPAAWLPQSIVIKPLASLRPSPTNARTHSAAQLKALAESIRRFGFPVPILIDANDLIIAGHGRAQAAALVPLDSVPCIVADHLTDDARRAYTLADNQLAAMSDWDDEALTAELRALGDLSIDLRGLGFDAMLAQLDPVATISGQDDVPAEAIGDPVSVAGTVYHLGAHRLMCGDSTDASAVGSLLHADPPAELLHADPPYGMGKEADGVENDNLYAAKLDAFQMAWWRTWRTHLRDNASAYVWGNAEGLWRLWFSGGLSVSERLTLRNDIVWDKESAIGIASEERRSFSISTERCLFFMLGEQGFGNVNKADYWEGFEPIRGYLADQAKVMAWGAADINRITGVGMFGHWFSKSQWTMMPERHYRALYLAADGRAFTRSYADLRALYDGGLSDGGHLAAKAEFYGTRAYFDNTHDNMTEVWRFPRVTGADRHDHATPKPVDMIARAIKSSCPPGGLVLEPFGGSGTTLIAAAKTGRVCRMMEITPRYCDTIRRRWTTYAQANGLDLGSGALV